MKFKVREGFVVHTKRVIEIDTGADELTKQIQENSFYAGQTVDFTAEEAEAHLHKLEPLDKEATKYVESRFAVVTEPVVAPGISSDTLAQIVASAVTAALAAQSAQSQTTTPPGSSS